MGRGSLAWWGAGEAPQRRWHLNWALQDGPCRMGLAEWVGVDKEGQSLVVACNMCGCSGPGRRLRLARQVR